MLYEFRGRQPQVGRESYVSDLAVVIGDVVIGGNCYIGHGAILRGDYGAIVIGDGTAVEEGVIVHAPPAGASTIGEHVTIGHGAIVHSEVIGSSAVVGMGAVLSIGSQVGEHTVIAEGCVVKMNQTIPPGVVVAGNPGRVIRPVGEKDREFWSRAKQLYVDLAREYAVDGMRPVGGG